MIIDRTKLQIICDDVFSHPRHKEKLLKHSIDVIITSMIEEIRQKIACDQFELSRHAVDQSLLRHISIQELRETIHNGEIIEDYPDDKYGPSCLIFGETNQGRPIHVQCSYPSRPLVKIITLYQPAPSLWKRFRIRRR